MKQPYNTALYMRLSRDDENYGDSVSIETQRTILQQYAKEHGLSVYGEYPADQPGAADGDGQPQQLHLRRPARQL